MRCFFVGLLKKRKKAKKDQSTPKPNLEVSEVPSQERGEVSPALPALSKPNTEEISVVKTATVGA